MKKIFLMLIICIVIFGKNELVSIEIDYNSIMLSKIKDSSGKELLVISGLLKNREVIKEVYQNDELILAERYKYSNNGEKKLFYQRKVQKDIDDEVIFYENGNKRQEFVFYPNGVPDKERKSYDLDIKFFYAYYSLEGKIEEIESGKYPLMSNAYFSPLFKNLAISKEVRYLMDLKK
jgi:antitoxin component YwqK of YwqJK toxin-antitoxin module